MGAVATAEKPAVDVKPPKERRLKPNKLKAAEHCFGWYFVKAEPGDTIDDIRAPAYLGHYASRLQRHAIIRILTDAEDQEAWLTVDRTTQKDVFTSVLLMKPREPLSDSVFPVDDDHYCQRLGGKGFCIVRRRDGHPIHEGHTSPESAKAEFFRSQPRPVIQ